MPLEYDEDIFVCGARQALSILKTPGIQVNTEVALGILANLSRNHSVIHKALQSRDDFDLLRKLLLRIMDDETSKEIEIVLTMSIIYHLFGITDKYFEFLSSLFKRDLELRAYIKTLIFNLSPQEGSHPILSGIAKHLMHPTNYLLSASTARFLFLLLSSSSVEFENSNTLIQLLSIITQAVSVHLEPSDSHEVIYRQRLVMHCASLIIQKASQICSSMDGESIDISGGHVAHLGHVAQTLAQHNLEDNTQLINVLTPSGSVDSTIMENGGTVATMLVTVDALDLLLSCTDFLSIASPVSATQKSQENMDPDETRIDCTPPNIENLRLTDDMGVSGGGAIAGHLQRCGDALQRCLEAALLPPILALTLVINDSGIVEGNFSPRAVVLRLMRIALSLQNFSTASLLSVLNTLFPPGCSSLEDYMESRILSLTKNATKGPPRTFLSEWLISTHPQYQARKQRNKDATSRSYRHYSEATLNKLCAALDKSTLSFASIAGSEAMTICQRRIEFLQSRESALEVDVAAKREALRTADALAEQFRTRAVTAEAEITRLLRLQTVALANAESQRVALDAQKEKASQHEEEIQRLSAELAAKKKECEALQATKTSLQTKLTSMREQNRSMDATIDNFRKQLDEAKQVINQKDAEIQQYTNMARIINELTGNKVQAANLSNSKNI
ncbi:hypothetical protein Aperf_G00000075852 [Anoplocephala perfoliata]